MDMIDTLWMQFTPFHPDQCNHGEHCYRGSIQYQEGTKTEKLDVYVFEQQEKQSICIRYGDEPSQYYSPINDWIIFIRQAEDMPSYREALKVLTYTGRLTYQPYQNLKRFADDAWSICSEILDWLCV